MGRVKSETRQLTEGVYVRFSPTDLGELRQEAERLGVSVAHLLRESALHRVRPADLRAS